jgi:hypothetical protein
VAKEPSDSVASAEASARMLLTEMRDISEESIETVVAETVTWNDGSMGCPQPDRSYTQSLVPGFRVVLAADDVEYSFHGADGGTMRYCANPSNGFNPNA